MKKQLSILLLISSLTSYSQILLEKEYVTRKNIGELENGLVIYFDKNIKNDKIEIYAGDHSLKTTITLKQTVIEYDEKRKYVIEDIGKFIYAYSSFATDHLFDADDGVEVLCQMTRILSIDTVSNRISKSEELVVIIDDNGSLMFEKKDCYLDEYVLENNIFLDGEIYKLRLNTATGTAIYKLPGVLNSTVSIDDKLIEKQLKPSAFPNPAIEYTKIAYKLPVGVDQADLVIYDATGKEIQRSKVGSMFNDILVNTTSFQQGTYIYHLVTNESSSLQGKFVVMK